MKWAVEMSIHQVAGSLIHNITDKSSKLRLLTFEIRALYHGDVLLEASHIAQIQYQMVLT